MRFDHIGIVARTLVDGRNQLGPLFGIAEWTREFLDPLIKVYVQFGRDPSGVCYEIIAPLGDDSPVLRTLRKMDRILNHVAYLVPDLDATGAKLRTLNSVQASEITPAVAYGGARVQFFMTATGFLVELIEDPGHEHSYFSADSPGELC